MREIRAENERLELAGAELLQEVGRLEWRGRPRKPLPTATAAQQEAWRARGRYLAAVRRLPKADRARVKAIREKKGVAPAIAAAKRLGK